MDRLYVVTRRDLPPGAQGAQSQHALSEFAVLYPEEHRRWHVEGRNLIWLAALDEGALSALLYEFELRGLKHASFHEPDLGDQLTAFAVEGEASKLLSSLPLALRVQAEAA